MRFLVVAIFAIGCSNNSNGGSADMTSVPDMSQPPDMTPPSDLAPPVSQPSPPVVPNSGTIFANPHLVTITFPGDTLQTMEEAFGDFVIGSNWWPAVGAEYGIKTGTHTKYHFATAPTPFSEPMVLSMIKSSTDALLPKASATEKQIIYLIYIPHGMKFTDAQGMEAVCGMSGADGYHYYDTLGGVNFSYAINGDCGNSPDINFVTSTSSHEIIEAATDPIPNNATPGWQLVVDNTSHWIGQQGDEVADLCQLDANITEGSFQLQRSWSNAAAAANKGSPCVPVPPNELYMNVTAAPAPLTVAAGGTATYTLGGWSTAPTADWMLSGFACDSADFDPMPDFAPATIGDQKTATITLHVPTTAQSGQVGCTMVFSGPPQTAQDYWPVSVIVQ
jgi:hypothetical protein